MNIKDVILLSRKMWPITICGVLVGIAFCCFSELPAKMAGAYMLGMITGIWTAHIQVVIALDRFAKKHSFLEEEEEEEVEE